MNFTDSGRDKKTEDDRVASELLSKLINGCDLPLTEEVILDCLKEFHEKGQSTVRYSRLTEILVNKGYSLKNYPAYIHDLTLAKKIINNPSFSTYSLPEYNVSSTKKREEKNKTESQLSVIGVYIDPPPEFSLSCPNCLQPKVELHVTHGTDPHAIKVSVWCTFCKEESVLFDSN
jgi:hypothetical protein